jgi:DNA replication licensing factor MCM3
MSSNSNNNSLLELRASYDEFLRSDRFGYADLIGTAVDDHVQRSQKRQDHPPGGGGGGPPTPSSTLVGHPRLRVPLSDLRSHDPRLSNALLRDPLRHLRALESAAHELALEERPGYDLKGDVRVRVALGGPIGGSDRPAMGPRDLGSSSLRRLVCVEGVAVKVSSVKPKVVRSVHYCPASGAHESRTYVDATDPELGLPVVDESGRELPDRVVQLTSSSYPTVDREGRPLETEFGLSSYKDHQTVTLQEMPERAPMGQLPRSVELVLDHDLVDRVKPGDRVQVVGVYRALSFASQGQRSTSGVFPTVVLVNDVRVLGRDSHGLVFTPHDVRTIRSLGKRDDILDVLGRSVCPSIHGHDVIKRALALQLLGGCEKNLPNGTHLRGDINILMVGDPSTAKSQLLRSAMGIAPLAVSTTGKGSSGVGLTAAVTSDPETRERRLEAGAMVLADRGLVCVDEFDKMSEGDRVAIHEAMEQQTVTIAKAGIHASLNARCSVLAAANPVYGQYDRRRRVQENIGLPDSLLSRFDLLFVVLDQMDPESDRRIAAHVIRGHRYQDARGRATHESSEEEDDTSDDDEEDGGVDAGGARSVWVRSRYDSAADGSSTGARHPGEEDDDDDDDPHRDDVLQHEFLRKYLHFAKTRMRPVLTEEARECIAGRYAEMRSRQDERTLPVTARSLETIIRLASAHAKVRKCCCC